MTLPPLLVLTDRHQLPRGRSLADTVRACATAGLTTVVLRELDLPETQRAELAGTLSRHVTVISARTPLPAAAGVHLAAHQPAVASRHGRSCHDAAQLRTAVATGAAWVTLSPVAHTPSKPGYGPALGVEGFSRLLPAAARTPVYALGGVDPANAAAFRRAGAHGVAVMGAVMRAEDPAAVVGELLEVVAVTTPLVALSIAGTDSGGADLPTAVRRRADPCLRGADHDLDRNPGRGRGPVAHVLDPTHQEEK